MIDEGSRSFADKRVKQLSQQIEDLQAQSVGLSFDLFIYFFIIIINIVIVIIIHMCD